MHQTPNMVPALHLSPHTVKRILSAALGVLATGALSGCIPLPFVVPPTEVNVGAGQAMGTVVPAERVANTDPSLTSDSETFVRARTFPNRS